MLGVCSSALPSWDLHLPPALGLRTLSLSALTHKSRWWSQLQGFWAVVLNSSGSAHPRQVSWRVMTSYALLKAAEEENKARRCAQPAACWRANKAPAGNPHPTRPGKQGQPAFRNWESMAGSIPTAVPDPKWVPTGRKLSSLHLKEGNLQLSPGILTQKFKKSSSRPKAHVWSFRSNHRQWQGFVLQASPGKLPSPQQSWCTASVLQSPEGAAVRDLGPAWPAQLMHIYALLVQGPLPRPPYQDLWLKNGLVPLLSPASVSIKRQQSLDLDSSAVSYCPGPCWSSPGTAPWGKWNTVGSSPLFLPLAHTVIVRR